MLNRDYTVESVDTALQLLLILRRDGTIQLSSAALELGVAKSTVHRLLGTLQRRGFVIQDAQRKYLIGPHLEGFNPKSDGSMSLRTKAHKHLSSISRRFHETARISILEGSNIRILDGVVGEDSISVSSCEGERCQATQTPAGMVILAFMHSKQLEKLLNAEVIVPLNSAFTSRLAAIRTLGYAFTMEHPERGVSSVAAPIFDSESNVIGAIEICIPRFRSSPSKLRNISSALIETATHIRDELSIELSPMGVA